MDALIPLLAAFCRHLGSQVSPSAREICLAYQAGILRTRNEPYANMQLEEAAWKAACAKAGEPNFRVRDITRSVTRRILADFGALEPDTIAVQSIPSELRARYGQTGISTRTIFASLAVWLERQNFPVHAITSATDTAALAQARTDPPESAQVVGASATSKDQAAATREPTSPRRRALARIMNGNGGAKCAGEAASNGSTANGAAIGSLPDAPRVPPKCRAGTRVPRVEYLELLLAHGPDIARRTLLLYRSSCVTFLSWLCSELGLVEQEGEVSAQVLIEHKDKLLAELAGDETAFEQRLACCVKWLNEKGYSTGYSAITRSAVRRVRRAHLAALQAAA